jgi:all-trans-retinol 13,14-reductase
LGGLLSSALLAKEGKKVLMLEQHRIPGGYCTSYKRNGFIFNIPSVLSGVLEGELYSVLDSLGLFRALEWVKLERFAKFVYPDFEMILPANDLAGCRENFRTAFASEKKAIDKVFSDIDQFKKSMSSLNPSGRSIRDLISLVPVLPKLILFSRKSYYDYLKKLTSNERAITVLSTLWGYAGLPSKRLPALLLLMMYGECCGKEIFFPKEGYQAVSDFLAKKILEFGGEIKYKTAVSKILIEDKKAVGVETATGDKWYAEAIVSNADTKKTFLELVGRQHLPQKFALNVDAHTPSASGICLHIGTDLDLSQLDLKYGSIFYHESWEDSNIFYDKAIRNEIDLEKDNIILGLQASSLLSESLAPKGINTLHIALYPISLRYNNSFGIKNGARGDEYKAFKEQVADILIGKVEKLIPGLSKSIIVKELSTPYTFERYTGATDGAWYDGVFSINQKFQRSTSKTPIENLYLTGTKAFGGGGLGSALNGGIQTSKTILGR